MKHLPFNHTWNTLGYTYRRQPTDHHITGFMTVTVLRQFCACGKVRTVEIAPFKMDESHVKEYVAAVYG